MDNDNVTRLNAIWTDFGQMKEDRRDHESRWNEIIDYVAPRTKRFGEKAKRNVRADGNKVFDATARQALRNFTAAMSSMITPQSQVWHRLSVSDPTLAENQNVKVYLDQVNEVLFSMRYRWRSGFSANINATYDGLGAFGTGVLMIDYSEARGIRYRRRPLAGFYFAEDESGLVDRGIDCWSLTARQAAQKFGYNALPERIKRCVDKSPLTRFDFIHNIQPRSDFDPTKRDSINMPFESLWISGHEDIITESGFTTFPYAVGRFYMDEQSPYGGSPAEDELPDVRMGNDMERTIIRAAQKMVDPPLLLSEDGALEGFDLRAGQLNWGGLDEKGQEMVKPLQTGANLQLGMEYAEQKRTSINAGFYNTLFQILVNAGDMTATEVMQRAQEKGMLLAPPLGRIQNEMLGAMIDRELSIASKVHGMLPQMPQELIAAGGHVTVEYDSPLNHAMRAGEGTAYLQWIQQVSVIGQIDQNALRVVDGQKGARFLAEVNGIHADLLVDPDVIAQQQQQEAETAQMTNILNAAPQAAGAAKDLAQAAATSQAAAV